MRPAAHLLAVVAIVVAGTVGCDAPIDSPSPSPSAARPGILIDQTWTAVNGTWTFTGRVDPQDDPTTVVLEVGPGPATARRFDARLPVADDLTEPGPLSITTSDLPDIELICVRFAATNSGGTSTSTPLCIPHDIPSFSAAAPTVRMDPRWSAADGAWTFTGHIDPQGAATDVVLELGPGPESAATFGTQVPVATDMTEPAALTISTTELPDSPEVCVRFSAINDLGTTSSSPLCIARDAGSPSPAASAP